MIISFPRIFLSYIKRFTKVRLKSTKSIILTIILLQIGLSLWVYDCYFKDGLNKFYSSDHETSTASATANNNAAGGNVGTSSESTIYSFTKPIFNLLALLKSNSVDRINYASSLYKKMLFDTYPSWIDDYYLKSNLLTVSMGSNKTKQLQSIEELSFYDSDPRLVWSVYLYHILKNQGDHILSKSSEDFKLPFSWYDWSDFHNYNRLLSIKDKFQGKFNCQLVTNTYIDHDLLLEIEKELLDYLFLVDRPKYQDIFWYRAITSFKSGIQNYNISDFCTDYKENDPLYDSPFNLPFKVNNIWTTVRPEVYQISARNYLLNTFRNPLSMTILNSNKSVYQIDIEQDQRNNMIQSRLLSNFVKDNTEKKDDYKFDHIKFFEDFIHDTSINKHFKLEIPNKNDSLYQIDKFELTLDDFKFDIKSKIEELESIDKQNDKKLSLHEKNYLNSLKNSYRTHPAFVSKYLQEADKLQGSAFGSHRDRRFYNGATADTGMAKEARMNSLIRTFQKFVQSSGLVSWISHGTLYAHLYDGLVFPWDGDFDIQMPIKHLHLLAQYFNQSLILEDPREGNGRYFLDVTSSISVRTNANGKNNIDARFIDVDSGVYIDITGLSVSSAPYKKGTKDIIAQNKYNEVKEQIVGMDKTKLINPELGEDLASKDLLDLKKYMLDHKNEFTSKQLIEVEKMVKKKAQQQTKPTNYDSGLTDAQIYLLHERMNMINCRNNHFSRLDMISPLRLTYFHGARVYIPNKAIESLQVEYTVPKKYGFQSFEGKIFIPKLKQWILFPILKKIANINGMFDNMLPLKSEVNALSFSDLKSILLNMIIGEYYDLFSYTVTTFDVTNYRVKELEVMFDTTISVEEKSKLLSFMRDNIGDKMNSPMKDALLLDYESRIWRQFEERLTDAELQDIKKSVFSSMVEEISEKFTIFNSNQWFGNKLLGIKGYKNDMDDIDKVGLDIYDGIENQINTIFESDPEF